MNALDRKLVAAHEAGDGAALVTLYQDAAAQAATETARGFYLTHAYVFALEAGHAEAEALRTELVDMGREPPA